MHQFPAFFHVNALPPHLEQLYSKTRGPKCLGKNASDLSAYLKVMKFRA